MDTRASALVSSSRLDKLIQLEDREEMPEDHGLKKEGMKIENAEFAWTSQEQMKIFKMTKNKVEYANHEELRPVLKNINLEIKP